MTSNENLVQEGLELLKKGKKIYEIEFEFYDKGVPKEQAKIALVEINKTWAKKRAVKSAIFLIVIVLIYIIGNNYYKKIDSFNLVILGVMLLYQVKPIMNYFRVKNS